MNCEFIGGIADGAKADLDLAPLKIEETPQSLWIRPGGNESLGLQANIKGNGQRYNWIGFNANSLHLYVTDALLKEDYMFEAEVNDALYTSSSDPYDYEYPNG